MVIDDVADLAAGGESAIVHARRQAQVADLVVRPAGVAADAERPELRAEVAGAAVLRGAGDRHVRRQVLARAELVRHHGTETRMHDRRALAVAGVHGVTRPAVIRLLAGDGADDGQLVGDLGQVAKVFIQDDAGQFRLGHAERAAILQRGVGLGVPRFLVGHAAGQDDLDDALGRAFLALVVLLVGPGLHLEEVAQGQTESPDHADAQELAAAGLPKVGRVVFPGHDGSVGRHANTPFWLNSRWSIRQVRQGRGKQALRGRSGSHQAGIPESRRNFESVP